MSGAVPFYRDDLGREYLTDIQLELHPEWKSLVEAQPINRNEEPSKFLRAVRSNANIR